METCPKLTPTQALLLRAAARVTAMIALMRREWIEASDGGFVLSDASYAVAGRKRPGLNVVLTRNAAGERGYRIG